MKHPLFHEYGYSDPLSTDMCVVLQWPIAKLFVPKGQAQWPATEACKQMEMGPLEVVGR